MNFASDVVYAQHSDSEDDSVSETELDERTIEEEVAAALSGAAPGAPTSGGSAGAAHAAPPPPAPHHQTRSRMAPRDSRARDAVRAYHLQPEEGFPSVAVYEAETRARLPGPAVTMPAFTPVQRRTSALPTGPAATPAARQPPRQEHGRRVAHHVDTNVVSVSFGSLTVNAPYATGDPVICTNCSAVLSAHSKLVDHTGAVISKGPSSGATGAAAPAATAPAATAPAATAPAATAPAATATTAGDDTKTDTAPAPPIEPSIKLAEGDQLWKCEFCNHDNVVSLDQGEIPTAETLDYILEPAPVVAVPAAGAAAGEAPAASTDSSILMFCLDISGSMGEHDDARSRLRRSRQPTRSRLAALQSVVCDMIEKLKDEKPQLKVGLITFSDRLHVVGDGSGRTLELAGDVLNNADKLRAAGETMTFTGSIKDTHSYLSMSVRELKAGGNTALGPACLVSLAMAGQLRGSKIIVVTDGMANCGLGSMGSSASSRKAVEFYSALGVDAAAKGVVIDVIGVAGERCGFETITPMVEAAAGNLTKVDPSDLTTTVHSSVAVALIASEVDATILLHSGLKFRNVDESTSVVGNKMKQAIGNVTADTAITFEYRIKASAELAAEGLTRSSLSQLPFQVQIKYRKLDGSKCVRVITQSKRVSSERTAAEAAADFAVLSAHAEQTAAKLARKGDYTGSRGEAMLWNRYMAKNMSTERQQAQYVAFSAAVSPMYSAIQSEVASERATMPSGAHAESSVRSMREERRTQNDSLSSAIFQAKKSSLSRYT